jgi:hypothetical protein
MPKFIIKLALIAAAVISASLNAQTNPLAYTPVDAQYSVALDQIIMVSANPNQLHIYNPISQTDVVVGLPKPPLAVSVSPDGMYAAVGHDALVTYVNLATASIVQTYDVSFTAQIVVLGESWIYVLAAEAVSIDIATGVVTPSNLNSYNITSARLDSPLNSIYAVSGNGLLELNVSTGPITSQSNSSYSQAHPVCGPVWLSADGSQIYDGCGTIFTASANTALNFRYVTTMTGQVQALAASTGLVAAVPGTTSYPPGNDGLVMLFSGNYLQPAGQFVLPGFTAAGNSLTGHGRWVFFNDAAADLFVLMLGETPSGNAGGFAIQTYSLATPPSCGASFATSSASVIGAGSLGQAAVTASATCIYQASSDSAWLQIVSGGYGSGDGTLTWLARANAGASQRVGHISIGGQEFTVTQAGAAPPSAFTQLAYNVVASAYDNALDNIIFVAANPNELHIYNPVTQADQVVPLAAAPLSVSVRPDGAYAAVGHQGWVSYVNLQTAAVQQVFTVGADANYIVLAGNGYMYLFSDDGNLYSLLISTGTQSTTAASFYGNGPARLYTDDQSIYQANGSGRAKWSISAGVAANDNLPYSAPSSCGNLWIAEDGLSIVTECGSVYSASETPALDLQYLGALSNAGAVVWAAESDVQYSTAVIPGTNYQLPANDTQVQVYGDAYLNYVGSLALPQFMAGGSPYAGHGKFTFWNNAGTSLYVVEQADSTAQLLSSYAVDAISPSPASSGCTFTLGSKSANEPASLGFDSVVVTTGATCVWSASSSASWLTITAGAFSFGSGDLAFSFTANTAGTPRAATLTIAGQTFTVTQAAGTVTTYTVSGQVTHAGNGLGGVNILLSPGGTTTTDSSGNYSFNSLAQGGNYTVTPILGDYSFSPSSLTFSNVSSNQTANFQANLQYDFNGGPGPDVVWEDPTSGFAQIWYLGGPQGVTTTGAADLTQSNPWRIVGIADFNGDGTPDVLWQDPVSGAVQVWYLGGAGGNVLTGSADITNRNAWKVVSVADFNQDGHPDILWQDPVSGFSQIWYMGGAQGTTILGAANLDQTNPWNIVGCADFNGDGVPDVLWQDPQSGTVQIWYMGGTEAGAQGSQLQTAVNLTANPWRVAAIADFNLDGHPDVVFQDPVTGGAQVFFYTGALGTTLSGTAVLSGPNPWSVAGPH